MFRIRSWRDVALHSLLVTGFALVGQAVMSWMLIPAEHFQTDWWIGIVITLLLAPALAAFVASDLLRLQRLEMELKQRLAHDELTGLLNRRDLAERDSQLTDMPGVVFFIDVDHFKRVNDENGHDFGDEILCLVAQALQSICRPDDIVVRYGGDEFVVFSPGLRPQDVPPVSESLLSAVRMNSSKNCVDVTISGGWAYKPAGVSFAQVLSQADQGLYAAKAEGRNKVMPSPETVAALSA